MPRKRKKSVPTTRPSPSSLDDQLALVVEQEGMNLLSADGVRFMRGPTHVEAGKRSARKRPRARSKSKEPATREYAGHPIVSAPADDRVRDAVADLDRVVVGFLQSPTPRLKRVAVDVRMAEHARSPYVVSLRGITLSSRPTPPDERLSQAALSASVPPSPFVGKHAVPNLEVVAALASDMRMEGAEEAEGAYREQFTPPTFRAAYALSYGSLHQAAYGLSSFVTDIGRLLTVPTLRLTVPSFIRAPAEEDARGIKQRVVADATPVFQDRLSFARAAFGIIALLAIATLPANAVRLVRSLESGKASAIAAGEQGVAEARVAGAASMAEGEDALRRASAQFRAADDALDSMNALAVGLAGLVPKTRSAYQTARALTEIGEKSSEAGTLLARGFSSALGTGGTPILDRLGVMSAYAQGALPLLEDAARAFQNVDANVLPENQRAAVAELSAGIDDGRVALREFTGMADLLVAMLGKDEPRRYLVIFQNPSELRPTGGFMGSFAEVTLDRGEVRSLNVPPGGTYALQGDLTARVAPPEPLRLIADRWEFQDSNWSPDFAQAAEKIRFFWSKAGGPTMDGIIAVNATFVEKLLAQTGPVDLPAFGKTITADNFMLEVQKSVELEYDREENEPKKILGALAPILMERIKALPQSRMLPFFALVSDALETKDIQMSLSLDEEDALARRYGWSGLLKPTDGDAFALIGANIAGQKTDLSIEEQVTHVATIGAEGSIEDAVTVTRAHTAPKGEVFRGVRNVEYFRFYVPRGATLLAAEGFTPPDPSLFDTLQDGLAMDPDEAELARTRTQSPSGLDVWDEGDRTVFGGWSMVDPGATATLSVRYRLPFSAQDLRARLNTGPEPSSEPARARAAYTLLLTSQSGTPLRRITSSVVTPSGWTSVWGRNAEGLDTAWDRDLVVAGLYEVE